MARQRNAKSATTSYKKKKSTLGKPPAPFKEPHDVLKPLIDTLDPKHVYILHVDNKPASFKRKIFMIPVAMNLAIFGLLVWRLWYILPWYLALFASALGYPNETTMIASEVAWDELIPTVLQRAMQFTLDFVLCMFLWPWPIEFAFGSEHGNPVSWRLAVGFRDREIVVRRSRKWDQGIGDVVTDESGKSLFAAYISSATAPFYLEQKTGYLTRNGEWELDWDAMVHATFLVDKKMAAMEAFKLVVLVHSDECGWLAVDMKIGENAEVDNRRRQIFAFRDALTAVGKDKLFYRWIEIVEFESTQPGGFDTSEKQEKVAQQVRDLFQDEGVDFDEFWKASVGSDGLDGM